MPVEILVKKPNRGGFSCYLGWGDMVYCFFSSVSYNLEGPGNWGKRFPRLLLDLCDHGVVENQHLDELQQELVVISRELQKFPLSAAVYDIEDLTLPIPWEVVPGEENNNLAQPWVTPRGEESYFTVIEEQIELAKREDTSLLLIFARETADRQTRRARFAQCHPSRGGKSDRFAAGQSGRGSGERRASDHG